MPTLETLQAEYEKLIGKLPNNKKNDVEWISAKLEEYNAWKPVDSTPDEDWNATPEEGMITKPEETEVTKEEVKEEITKTEEVKAVPEAEKKEETKETEEETKEDYLDTVKKLQSFHGITNDEMHNENILKEKYKLKDKEIKVISSFTKKDAKDVDLNLNYHDMPDYIQVIYQKYGFNPEILKNPEAIKKMIIKDPKKPTKEEDLQVHQLTEYYNSLRQESTKNDKTIENPNIVKSL